MPNDILSNILTPIALALMMTGMGLTLTPSDFTRLFKKPKAILVGLLGQMVGLPLLGFLVASLFALPALQSAGMMILVLRAGGVVSGLLTQMVKGDSALSITMTAISMLFGIFTIPLLVNASLHYFMQQNQTISLDLVNTSLRLLAITVLPVLAGMLLRHHFCAASLRLQPKLTRLSNLMLVTIIGLSLHSYHADILQASAVLLMPLIVLNLLAMLLGFTGARIANLGNKATKTLVIEVGIQNSATGIFIATTLLNNTLLALPAIIYTGIAFVNFAIFMLILKFIAKLGTENGYAKQA